jgi:hypothetical protein
LILLTRHRDAGAVHEDDARFFISIPSSSKASRRRWRDEPILLLVRQFSRIISGASPSAVP